MRGTKRPKVSKLISLVLSVALLLGTINVNGVMIYASEGKTNYETAERAADTGVLELANVTSEYSKPMLEISDYQGAEFDGELIIDTTKNFNGFEMELLTSGEKLVAVQTEEAAVSDEITYIESVIEALSEPVGAVGFEESIEDTVDVIVWLQELPNALAEAYGIQEAAEATASYSGMGKSARNSLQASGYEVKFSYSEVFSGLAMTVPASMVDQLANMPGVYAVLPDELQYASETDCVTDPNYELVGMQESREVLRIGEIHEAGITGKKDNGQGVIVGVLDSGIDYNHPDFAGVYKGGKNYIAAASDPGRLDEYKDTPMETTYDQWLTTAAAETNSAGNTYYTSHGTHVSGTIAAQALNGDGVYKALGIAPGVDLYVARVLGNYGSGPTSGIIAAVEDFTSGSNGLPKADVINLSLGANNNTAYGANVFALNNAVIAGVNVAVAAGNNAGTSAATRQMKTLGTPGTAYLPLTVAASQYGGESVKTYDNVTASSDNGSENFSLFVEGKDTSNIFEDDFIGGTPAPIYVEGLGYECYLAFGSNDTNPTAEQLALIPDGSLEGKILVVKRGIEFTTYLAHAKRAGAGGLIIVNNAANGEAYITNTAVSGSKVDHMPIFSAYHSASAKLTALAEGAETVYLQLGELRVDQAAKEPAYFSSIGPVNESFGLKPDIIAPGYNILSTQPAFDKADHDSTNFYAAYTTKSGTSMATPHMAGIMALMVQVYPDATPAEIKARLMNTSEVDFIKALSDGTQASVFEVGAGFVSPYRALIEDTTVYVTVQDDIPGETYGAVVPDQTLSSLSFGYSGFGEESRKIPVTVHNAEQFSVGAIYNDNTRYSKNATENGVRLMTDFETGNNTFNAWLDVPMEAAVGYYEGYLVITADDKEYTLPWAAVVGASAEYFDCFFFSQRPIISTTNDTNVRANILANYSTLFYSWEGYWPGDQSDVVLIDADTMELKYYFGTLTEIGEGGGLNEIFFYQNYITHNAYPIEDGRVVAGKEVIEDGPYYLALSVGSKFLYSDAGLVFSSERPILTLSEDIPVSNDPAVTEVCIEGRVYSPSLALAQERGFVWQYMYNYELGEAALDQSWNVLGMNQTTPAIVVVGGTPWVCNEEGYFKLYDTVTQDNKDSLEYIFNSGGNHSVVGVDCYGYNINFVLMYIVFNDNGVNKSLPVTPRLKPVGEIAEFKLVNNGEISLELLYPPASAGDKNDYIVELFVGDRLVNAEPIFSYDSESATATWIFDPVKPMGVDTVLEACLTYGGATTSDEIVVPAAAGNIKSVANPEPILAFAGTAFEDLDLPALVSVTLEDESLASVDVEWHKGGYNPEQAGEYTLTGALILADESSITNANNLTAEITVTVTILKRVVSITNPDNRNAIYGTEFANLELPATVKVTLHDDTMTDLSVVWAEGDYNPAVSGTYAITGTLVLTDGVLNPENVTAHINVTIPARGIVSFVKPAEVVVPYGTVFANLGLPTTVEAVLDAGENAFIPVTWSNTGYSQTVLRTVTLSSNGLTLGDQFTNSGSLQAKVDVTTRQSKITGVTNPGNLTIPKGTQFVNISLPTQVAVTYEVGSANLTVTWDDSTYDPETIGEYTITGTISGYSTTNYVNSDNVQPSFKITVIEDDTPKNIISVTTPAAVTVDFLTSYSDMLEKLPATVGVTLENSVKMNVGITWDGETNYNGDVAGTYTVRGTLNPPSGVTNNGNLTASISVTVNRKHVVSIVPMEPSTARYGTSFTNTPLGGQYKTMNAVFNDGTSGTIDVTFTSANTKNENGETYLSTRPGVYTSIGTVRSGTTLAYVNTLGLTTEATLTLLAKHVTAVRDLNGISVPFDTPFASLDLPATVDVRLVTDSADVQVGVIWSDEGYNPTVAGTYVLTGELVPGADASNPDNLTAKIEVTVEPVVYSDILSVKTNLSALNNLVKGKTLRANALMTFAPGVPSPMTVTWKSSNSTIATVSNDGLITGMAPGTIMITLTVTSVYGTVKTSVFTVKVTM